MSKERLEEIKEQVKYLQGDLMRDDLGWLIEQAERVQELEIENNALKTVARSNKFIGEHYRQQNKRYREAIEKAIEMISESTGTITTPKEMSLYDAWILKSMLRETVLEGEE